MDLVPERQHVARGREVPGENSFAPCGGEVERGSKRHLGDLVVPALPPNGLDRHKGARQEVRAVVERPVAEQVLALPRGERLACNGDVVHAALERRGAGPLPRLLGPADRAIELDLVFEQQPAMGVAPKRRQDRDRRKQGGDRKLFVR